MPSGTDYEILTASLTIPAGPATVPPVTIYPTGGSLSFSVVVLADNEVENPETLSLYLSGGTSGLILRPYGMPGWIDPTPYLSGSTTITDNPAQVSIARATGAGGADGSEDFDPATGEPRPLRFILSRSGGNPAEALTVSYSIAGSGPNPADGQDYTSPGTSIEIPSGSSSVLLEIPVVDDDRVEAAGEGLTVTLTGGGLGCQYAQTSSSATGTIQDNDWEISSAAVSFDDQGITYDPQSLYTGTEWYDHDGNGSASTEAGEAKAAPISYWRSIPGQAHQITATPWFALRGNPMPGLYHIKGTGSGPGGGTFEGDVELVHADSFVYTWYVSGSFTSSGNLPDVIKKDELQISWEVKRVGPQPQTKSYGSSKNTIYVTWVSAPGQSETVLELACTAANGQAVTSDDDQREIALNVWGKFSGRSTRRVDGTEMKYSHAAGSGTSAAEMLAHPDGLGECAAWADLLVQVLTLDGVEAQTQELWWNDGFVVKEVPAQGSGEQPYTDGGTTALTAFRLHQVVRTRVLNRIFDPSYGGDSIPPDGAISPEQRWEDAFLLCTIERLPNQPPAVHANTPNTDLRWDAVLW